jgi:hypothetical protein
MTWGRSAVGVICAIGLAAACSWEETMQKHLQAYQGKSIKVLVARIGYPDSHDTMLGQRLYIWSLKGSTYATCKITVTTDEHDIITGSNLIGDRKSCNVYDDRLGE